MAESNVTITEDLSAAFAHNMPLLCLRLATLVTLVVLLTTHMRSLRVFRWEQSVSGGVLVTYCVTTLGLALCAGSGKCGVVFQAFFTITGFILLALNAAVLWSRWRRAEEMTRVVAEFLVALGVPVKRHMMTKIFLSAAAAILLFVDGLLVLMLSNSPYKLNALNMFITDNFIGNHLK